MGKSTAAPAVLHRARPSFQQQHSRSDPCIYKDIHPAEQHERQTVNSREVSQILQRAGSAADRHCLPYRSSQDASSASKTIITSSLAMSLSVEDAPPQRLQQTTSAFGAVPAQAATRSQLGEQRELGVTAAVAHGHRCYLHHRLARLPQQTHHHHHHYHHHYHHHGVCLLHWTPLTRALVCPSTQPRVPQAETPPVPGDTHPVTPPPRHRRPRRAAGSVAGAAPAVSPRRP